MSVFNGGITNQQTGLLYPKLLQQRGPLLQIEVSVPDVLANKLQKKKLIPSPVTGLGLLDPGASITGVDVNALQQLSLSMINDSSSACLPLALETLNFTDISHV